MKYALFNSDGTIVQACNDHTVAELPEGARELTDEQFANWPAYRLVNGVIVYSPPVIEGPTYQELRAAAYPPVTDGLDALVKGGQAWEDYKAACLAVKAKYPKP